MVMGEKPMCCHLVDLSPFCLIQPLPTSLMFCWVAEELWLLVVEAFMVFGSGVAGLSVPFPHPHSTHDCIHSPLFHDSSLPCFQHSRRWSVRPPDFLCIHAFRNWSASSSRRGRLCFFTHSPPCGISVVCLFFAFCCSSTRRDHVCCPSPHIG